MDGSAKYAARQATNHGVRHEVVVRRRHSGNTKDRTCRRLASVRKKKTDRHGRPEALRARVSSMRRLLFSRGLFRRDTAEKAHQFRLQRSERSLRHRTSWMNHDVPSRRNLRLIAPQDFTDTAPDAIAHHSAA